MSDDALEQLLRKADDGLEPVLLVLDENLAPLPSPRHEASRALSNRFDVCQHARKQGWPCSFSDFVITAESMLECKRAAYRLSKEKRVVEEVLQTLWQLLPTQGQLFVAGYKQEGIKTFAKRCEAAWDCSVEFERGEGQLHLYCFSKLSDRAALLQSENYHALQQVGEWQGLPLISKPGIFAWNRIDEGSAFLLEHLSAWLAEESVPDLAAVRALDLGCGNGLLALALLHVGCQEVVATDNNAAAIRAAEVNVVPRNAVQSVSVTADDCGSNLRGTFDVIVCNPPFHQGFEVEQDLTDRFLQITQRVMKAEGRALFVVNGFIPLDRKATEYFGHVRIVADNRKYKLIELKHY